jgi:hypothetical protein
MDRSRKNTALGSAVSGLFLSLVVGSSALLSACGSGAAGAQDLSFGSRKELPAANEVAQSGEQLDIAVRYLSFTDSNGTAVVNQGEVQEAMDYASRIWAQCGIGFRLENFQEIQAESIGTRFNPANYSELDQMRINTQQDTDLIFIATGKWNRSGTLGSSGSNCFSSFPGDEAEGIVCEKSSAASPTMIAHEVGHWVDLRHTNSPSTDGVDDTNAGNVGNNLMDHFVGPSNTEMTRGQCARARSAIAEWRRNAVLM